MNGWLKVFRKSGRKRRSVVSPNGSCYSRKDDAGETPSARFLPRRQLMKLIVRRITIRSLRPRSRGHLVLSLGRFSSTGSSLTRTVRPGPVIQNKTLRENLSNQAEEGIETVQRKKEEPLSIRHLSRHSGPPVEPFRKLSTTTKHAGDPENGAIPTRGSGPPFATRSRQTPPSRREDASSVPGRFQSSGFLDIRAISLCRSFLRSNSSEQNQPHKKKRKRRTSSKTAARRNGPRAQLICEARPQKKGEQNARKNVRSRNQPATYITARARKIKQTRRGKHKRRKQQN